MLHHGNAYTCLCGRILVFNESKSDASHSSQKKLSDFLVLGSLGSRNKTENNFLSSSLSVIILSVSYFSVIFRQIVQEARISLQSTSSLA